MQYQPEKENPSVCLVPNNPNQKMSDSLCKNLSLEDIKKEYRVIIFEEFNNGELVEAGRPVLVRHSGSSKREVRFAYKEEDGNIPYASSYYYKCIACYPFVEGIYYLDPDSVKLFLKNGRTGSGLIVDKFECGDTTLFLREKQENTTIPVISPENNNIVYAALYNDNIHESGGVTLSLHRTEEGAKKAVEEHKTSEKEKWLEWREDSCNIPEHAMTYEEFELMFPFGQHKDWWTMEMVLLD